MGHQGGGRQEGAAWAGEKDSIIMQEMGDFKYIFFRCQGTYVDASTGRVLYSGRWFNGKLINCFFLFLEIKRLKKMDLFFFSFSGQMHGRGNRVS